MGDVDQDATNFLLFLGFQVFFVASQSYNKLFIYS